MTRVPDAIVVGGGVFGCAVAYELARRRVSVLLLDRDLPGRATSASAGGLWPVGEAIGLGCGVIHHANGGAADAGLGGDPRPLPDAFRAFLLASNARFPDLADELGELSGVDIEYQPGAGLLFVIYDEGERAFVERVMEALPIEERLALVGPEEVRRIEPRVSCEAIGGAWLAGEYQVNPMLLCEAFKRAAVALGARFRQDARATGLRRNGDRIEGVEVGDEFLPCGAVVNAAGAWAGELAKSAGLDLPVHPVRGQIVLTEALPPMLSACLSTSACYLAQKTHGEVLIGSTTELAGFAGAALRIHDQSLSAAQARAQGRR